MPSRAHRSLVEAENALARQAQRHSDGWGIGYFVEEDAYVVKAASSAHACPRFRRTTQRLMSHTFVVHVRRATVGVVDPMNAHPFRYGRWLFAHNGTLLGVEALRPWMEHRTLAPFRPLILGDTDSEQIFFYLLSALAATGIDPRGHRPAPATLVRRTVREALRGLDEHARSLGLERPLLNLLLTDGRLFLAHRAGMPLWLSTQKHHCADLEVCAEPIKACMLPERPTGLPVNHLLVASEPISADENRWEPVADGSTITLDQGFRLQVQGPPPDWVAPVLPERLRLPPAPAAASG